MLEKLQWSGNVLCIDYQRYEDDQETYNDHQ